MWVAPLSAVDLEEIYAARIALESMTVRLTVPTMGDAQHAELVQLVDAMDRPEPSAQLIEVHRRFHRAITAASGERIGGLLEDLSDHAIRYRGLYRAIPANHGVSLSEHRGITDACIQGDAALASALVARHLARTALTTLAMLSPERPGTIIRTALQQAAVDKSPSELATA
jgi:DNA-binding GntR family transcriptional regulator